jgi:hypothetical protein
MPVISPRKSSSKLRELFDCIYLLGNWDVRRCSLEDAYRAVVFCFQRMVSEIETQSKGVVLMLDFQDFALHQIRHFTPPFVKKVANLLQVVPYNQSFLWGLFKIMFDRTRFLFV